MRLASSCGFTQTTPKCRCKQASIIVRAIKQQTYSNGQPNSSQTAMDEGGKPSRWAKLGQNMNLAGISLFFQVLGGNNCMALPHVSVPDISHIDWQQLKQAGFKGVVFDKDNTLTKPFEMQVEPRVQSSLERCQQVFGNAGMALYSNSAGLEQYDPHGHEAAALEQALGVKVVRHKDKKPSGNIDEVAAHFGCRAYELVMVGDRYLTDVVFGNRHGMMTIRPKPFTLQGEPTGVLMARRIEEFFVARWQNMGETAPYHALVTQSLLDRVKLKQDEQE